MGIQPSKNSNKNSAHLQEFLPDEIPEVVHIDRERVMPFLESNPHKFRNSLITTPSEKGPVVLTGFELQGQTEIDE